MHPLAFALLPAEAVDDQDVRALVDGFCDPLADARQLSDVEAAPRRIGVSVLKQPKLLAGRHQGCGQAGIGVVTAELNDTHRPVAACVQTGGELTQDLVGIMVFREGAIAAVLAVMFQSIFRLSPLAVRKWSQSIICAYSGFTECASAGPERPKPCVRLLFPC